MIESGFDLFSIWCFRTYVILNIYFDLKVKCIINNVSVFDCLYVFSILEYKYSKLSVVDQIHGNQSQLRLLECLVSL